MNTYIILAIISAIYGITFTMLITTYLSNHGTKINYWLIRMKMLHYVNPYRRLTIENNGKTGNYFYGFIVSWSLTLIFLAIGIIS